MKTTVMTDLAHLLADLNSDNLASYLAAKQQLIKSGRTAASYLINMMLGQANPQNWRTNWRAAMVLAAMSDVNTTQAFVEALQSPYPLIRQTAAQSLGEHRDRTAVPYLVDSLQDQNTIVVIWVIEALGNLRDQRAIDPLIALLLQTDIPTLQYGIIKALGRIGDKRAAQVIHQFFDANDHHVRSSAHEIYTQLIDQSVGD